ncbi:MAG: hypothetical protein ACYTGL_29625 [Planctomycetota bacterium]|jgi:hypothetical protein
MDRRIAGMRYGDFFSLHPDAPEVDRQLFSGPPYSLVEQQLIDDALARTKANAALYGWVSTMGLLQYFIAPVALVWSARLTASRREMRMKATGTTCAVIAAAALILMFYRGYFTSIVS